MERRRATAAERRDAVLAAAVIEFAAKGLHGASTEAIAAGAGISHPYLFKLFGTKRDLFLAASERVYAHVRDVFARAAAATPPGKEPLWEMGKAYYDLLAQRDELRLLLHGIAAAGDPEVGPEVRRLYADLYRFVAATSGAAPDAMHDFWAHGMLLTVAAAIDLPALEPKEGWVRFLLSPAALGPDT